MAGSEMASAFNDRIGAGSVYVRAGSPEERDQAVADLSVFGYELRSEEFTCPLSRKLTFKKACSIQQIGDGL